MSRNIRRIKILINDKDRKSWFLIFKEVLVLTITKKSFPLYYFGRSFYKKEAPNAKDFMNIKECDSILYSPKMQRNQTISILNNKLYFALFCETNGLETCKLLAYNIYNSFFYQNGLQKVNDESEFYSFCTTIFKENKHERIFIKLCESMGGKGIFSITPSTTKNEYNELWTHISNDSFIFQGAIEQHEVISAIFPNSINTIRLETYLTKAGNIEFLGGLMRFGSGKSVIDNVSSGGLYVTVNMEKGTLTKNGTTSLLSGAHKYPFHPTTNFEFMDFQIPFFQEALDLCQKFAQHIPNRIIGWDVAITPNGPIIIEGNHNVDIFLGEFSYNGFKNKPIYKEILQEI